MSARFTVNFTVLLAGAGELVTLFAFSSATAGWVAVGMGAVAIVLALYSFALPHQGVFQRCADIAICAVGAWAIVSVRVIAPAGARHWLAFGCAAALAALGAIGLVVREASLGRGLQVGQSRIGPDQFAHMSTLQRDAGVHS